MHIYKNASLEPLSHQATSNVWKNLTTPQPQNLIIDPQFVPVVSQLLQKMINDTFV